MVLWLFSHTNNRTGYKGWCTHTGGLENRQDGKFLMAQLWVAQLQLKTWWPWWPLRVSLSEENMLHSTVTLEVWLSLTHHILITNASWWGESRQCHYTNGLLLYDLLTDDVTHESMGQTSAVREESHIPLLQHTQPRKCQRKASECANLQTAEGRNESNS